LVVDPSGNLIELFQPAEAEEHRTRNTEQGMMKFAGR
jgi:hypothetical protein